MDGIRCRKQDTRYLGDEGNIYTTGDVRNVTCERSPFSKSIWCGFCLLTIYLVLCNVGVPTAYVGDLIEEEVNVVDRAGWFSISSQRKEGAR